MSQLEGELHKCIGARPAFLDQRFSERVEGKRVKIHVVGQKVGGVQGGLYHLLALEKEEEKVRLAGHSGDTRAEEKHTLLFSAADGAAAWEHTCHAVVSVLSRKAMQTSRCIINKEQWGAPSGPNTGGGASWFPVGPQRVFPTATGFLLKKKKNPQLSCAGDRGTGRTHSGRGPPWAGNELPSPEVAEVSWARP